MSKKYGKHYFYRMGQSDCDRGLGISHKYRSQLFGNPAAWKKRSVWPDWAKESYCAGFHKLSMP